MPDASQGEVAMNDSRTARRNRFSQMLAERKASRWMFFGGCKKGKMVEGGGGGSWKFEAFDFIGIKVLDFPYMCSIYDLLMLI